MTDIRRDDSSVAPGVTEPARRAWWRHIAVILVLAALTRWGLYFCGLVAVLIVLTDLGRHPYTRLGASITLAWWTFVWGRSSVPPLVGLLMMGAATTAYGAAALQQRPTTAAARNAVYGLLAAALAVLNVLPHGLRDATITKGDALTRALGASRADVAATHAQVVPTRERFTQRPIYLVLLFEPNRNAATTRDGEPCFRREEVHVVDGFTGAVDRRTVVDRLVLAPDRYQLAQARQKDGNCLPLPRGTSLDIVRIPAR